MGYDQTVEIEIKDILIEPMRIDEFNKLTNKFLGFEGFRLEKDGDGLLTLNPPEGRYVGRYVDSGLFALYLSKILLDGVIKLKFGEEVTGEKWGYLITSQQVYNMQLVWNVGDLLSVPEKLVKLLDDNGWTGVVTYRRNDHKFAIQNGHVYEYDGSTWVETDTPGASEVCTYERDSIPGDLYDGKVD